MAMMNDQIKTEITGAMPRTIRDFNRRVVLKAAVEREVFSASDIAADVALSRQSVMKAITHFLDKEIIISLGKGASTEIGGKKPELYTFRPKHRLITILHRTDEMVFQVMDLFSNCLDEISIPIDKSLNDEKFVEVLQEGTKILFEQNEDLKERLYGVSMAVGGQVEPKNHTMHRSMYFTNLSIGLPVYQILKQIFPEVRCIQVDCIGRMAGQSILLDEELVRKNERIYTLYFDRGITGCFFMDGKIQTDTALMLLEVGHMVLDSHDDELCTCGKYGCAESLISIRKVQKNVARLLQDYPDSCLARIPLNEIRFKDLFAGSRNGDELCRKEVRRLGQVIGHLLRNIFLVCNPGQVVLMGNFAEADEVFDQTLKEALQSNYIYTLREGEFKIRYERNDLMKLESLGSSQAVIKAFYEDELLYL